MFQSDTRRGGGPSRCAGGALATATAAAGAFDVAAATRAGGVVATSPEISPDEPTGAGTSLQGGVVVAAMCFSLVAPSMASADMAGPAPVTAAGGVAIGDCYGAKRRCGRARLALNRLGAVVRDGSNPCAASPEPRARGFSAPSLGADGLCGSHACLVLWRVVCCGGRAAPAPLESY